MLCLHSLTSVDKCHLCMHMNFYASQLEGVLKAMLQARPVMAKFRVVIGAMSTKAIVRVVVVGGGALLTQDIVTGEMFKSNAIVCQPKCCIF